MRGFIGIVMSVLVCSLGGCSLGMADVFKAEEDGDFKKALASDVHGQYYSGAVDFQINSQLSGGNHDVDGGIQGGGFPNGYGVINVNSNIYSELLKSGFSSARAGHISTNVNLKELKNFGYLNPVEMDLLKHFHVAAILKEGVRVQQYAELQKVADDPMYKLAARSQLLCINQELKKTDKSGRVSLDEAFDRCLKEAAFVKVGAKDGLLLKSLKLDTYSAKHKNIIDITGDVKLTGDDYVFMAPKKHVGNVLADNRREYITKIRDLLNQYLGKNSDGAEKYVVDEDELQELSLPGVDVRAYQIRNLALLEDGKASIAVAQLASRLAYIKTVQWFYVADECLRRALENPRVEPAYKLFIEERRQFLKEELASLATQKELSQDYANTMVSIVDQADQERFKIIKQIE